MFPRAESLIAVGVENGTARIWRYNNPASGAESNRPPVAQFRAGTPPLKVGEPVLLDAGGSTDNEPGLRFSWSIDSEYGFSEPTTNATFQVAFADHGTHFVALRVWDRHGETSVLRQRLDVSAAAEVVAGPDFRFKATGSLADAVFDPRHPLLYAADSVGRRILRLNLDTGFLEGEFVLPATPSALDLSPDGSRLFVTATTQGEFKGLLLELDSATGEITSQYRFAGEASDVVATGTRSAAVSADFSVVAIDFGTVPTGVHGVPLAQVAALATSGDRTVLIAGDTGGNISRLTRDPATGALNLESRTAGVSGDPYQHRPFLSPDGSRFILGDGQLYDSSFGSVAGIQPLRMLNPGGIQDAVFDLPERRAVFFSTDAGIRQFHAVTFELVRTLFPGSRPTKLGLQGPWIYSLMSPGDSIEVRRGANPAVGSEGNNPPVARFSMDPDPATVRTTVQLDARRSSDDRDSLSGLQFRWTSGDGRPPSEFNSDPVFRYRYPVAGRYTVRLEVRDSLGEINAAEQFLNVAGEGDPGEPVNQQVGDTFGGTVTEVVLDPLQPLAWMAELATGDVLRWNFETGQVERRWRVGGRATKLVFGSEGRRLYCVVDADLVGGNGRVAEFDPDTGVLLRQFPLELPPLDLLPLGPELLVVSSSSEAIGEIHVYRRDTGKLLNRIADPRREIRFAASSDGLSLFASDSGPSPDIIRYNLDPASGEFTRVASARANSWVGGSGGNVFLLPGGEILVTASGDRCDASLNFGGGFPQTVVNGVADVPDREGIALLNHYWPPRIEFHPFPGFGPVASRPLRNAGLGRSLTVRSNVVYVATDQGSALSVERFVYPARTAEENVAPTVRIVNPAQDGAVRSDQPVRIEVVAADDDGAVTNLTLWANGEKLAESAGPNLNDTFFLPEKKPYTLVAVAQDSFGAASTSAPVVLHVTDAPTATLVRPTPEEFVLAPADVTFEVAATDPDGSVRQVEFYLGERLLGISTAPPYTADVAGLSAYSDLRVVVEDNLGLRAEQLFFFNWLGLPGDEYARPFVLESAPATARASNREATRQIGDPTSLGGLGGSGRTVWWQWIAPTNGIVTLTTAGSSFDTLMGVYVVTNFTQRLLIAENDNGPFGALSSALKFRAVSGSDYRFVVDAASRDPGGDIVLNLDLAPIDGTGTAPNDAFRNRIQLEGTNILVTASNVGATREPQEPQIIAGVPGGRSLWWEWRPPGPGLVTISTAGSRFDTLLGVFRGAGTSVGSLQSVYANDDDPRGGTHSFARFQTRQNDRLMIVVDGFAGLAGDVRFQVEFEGVTQDSWPPNDAFEDRILIPNAPSLVLGSSLGARLDTREPSPFSRPVWWTWTAPATQPVVLSTEGSAFDTLVTVMVGERVTGLTTVARGSRGLGGGLGTPEGGVSFLAVGGQSYHIAVGGEGNGDRTGAIQLSVRPGEVLEPASLQSAGLDGQGRLQLRLESGEAHEVVVLSSTNLLHWMPVRTNRFEPGSVSPMETGPRSQEYFRGVIWDQ